MGVMTTMTARPSPAATPLDLADAFGAALHVGDTVTALLRGPELRAALVPARVVGRDVSGVQLDPLRAGTTLLDGTPWQISQAADKVVVLNVWGSWCEPCVAEAPDLVTSQKQLAKEHKDVTFLGINVGESAQTGAAGAQALGLPYPSLSDQYRTLGPALQNKATAKPTPLVLDRQSRIAARISGEIPSATTLTNIVETVASEGT